MNKIYIYEEFKCPRCGAPRLDEVMVNVTVRSEVNCCNDDGTIDYGDCVHNDGEVDGYECSDCGWRVPGVHTSEEFYAWLQNPNRDMSDIEGDPEVLCSRCGGELRTRMVGNVANCEDKSLHEETYCPNCDEGESLPEPKLDEPNY